LAAADTSDMPKTMHQRLAALSQALADPATSVAAPPPAADDRELIEILTRPIPGELTARAGHDHKEREIGTYLAGLSIVRAWHLYKRLTNPNANDALAAAFGRLVPERRARLVAFLGDARRRAALVASRTPS
jgi:hypothetical protein